MNYKDLALAEEEGKLEAAIAASRNLLIEAPTGSGKSLFIPYFLSKHCKGRVVVLQPRRIAALALAQFSAKLHGEPCGKTVGYQFRQDSCKSADTRILFQTYGNFLQELLHGKLDADWIVFDEYHERKADMDLLFGFFRQETRDERREWPCVSQSDQAKAGREGESEAMSECLRRDRAERPRVSQSDQAEAGREGESEAMSECLRRDRAERPRIAIMSAALNRSELETVLGVKCLSLGHPLYPVQIINQTPATGNSLVSGVGLDAEVVRALRTLYRNNIWQTTLVFLPGKAEIARCHTAAEALGNNCAEFLELYGGQDRETQDRIFEVTERPRVIFTTNIAETSITVPNVTGVVDSGIERVSIYDDSEKVNVLRTLPISMQNAIQRSGRSGRTQNGCAIRLWSEESEKRMPQGIVPEVLQIEPSELILQKAALEFGVRNSEFGMDCHASNEARNDVKGECSETAYRLIAEPQCHGAMRNDVLNLPTAIPEAREKTATALLEKFGMLQGGAITELGLKAIRTPVSSIPLALLLASAKSKADLPDLLLAALAWIHSGTEFLQKSKVAYDILTLASDTLSKSRDIPREVSFTLRQLRDYRENFTKQSFSTEQREEGNPEHLKDGFRRPRLQNDSSFTIHNLLKAFPDRLATPSGNAYKLANQNVIRLQVAEAPYAILALSMLRTGGGSKSELKVNLYAPIAKELLGGESAKTRYELLWRSGQERFTGVEISESENADGSTTELSRKEILTQEASPKVLEELKKLTVDAWREKIEKENWSGKFLTEAVQTQLIKMRLAAKLYPEYGLPEFNEEDMELIFDEFASEKFLLRDINEDRYRSIVEEYFGKSMLQWLGKTFPDHYVLPNGKRARYSYQEVAVSDDGKSVQSIEGVLVEISARIEDLMQLRGEHKIADGKLKVRYDILAPNFRTIQKTWDLTGFWQNTYAEVRKELRGRYPKHPWPEQVIQN
ncbi:ATP-dependent helicase C-terminal domain-containing protein [Fibrobacter sp.]|uniref:ATP-dependent helicase C-terminal domain-containing protein n=1 Tax=Fibrobacter sp. TaxID=35828 RepID=UPI002632BD4E|nr:ATP-dependent helicase C-terminal domain-containing protein [Fibrobacter sp.]MDD5943148.1 ATP-dependent helicase C-terminal domain-containing protein [Fibrobacter sp.]